MIKEVPHIDRQAGVECYCTDFLGINGRIKKKSDEFYVFELINDMILKFPYFSSQQDKIHKFPIFLLEKKGLDSNHAIIELKKKTGLTLKILGIKDAKAITTQYASSENTKNIPKKIETSTIKLSLIGFLNKPLSKSYLIGNMFKIKIDDVQENNLKSFTKEINKIANFYGLQRFGSERMVTHLVGKSILKGQFDKAIEYLLSYTSDYDSKFSKEIREKSRDPKNYSTLIKNIPRGMDLEKKIILTLLNGKGSISALRSIPLSIRRLFVHAYQSYVFNKCISTALLEGEDIHRCVEEDLCFEIEKPLVFGKIRRYKHESNSIKDVIPAVRLIGYNFQPRKNSRFDDIIQKIIKHDDISPNNFYIKDLQELSVQSGFRQTSLCCMDFRYSGSINLSFKLPKGSYATTLLREIIKPNDPIRAGF